MQQTILVCILWSQMLLNTFFQLLSQLEQELLLIPLLWNSPVHTTLRFEHLLAHIASLHLYLYQIQPHHIYLNLWPPQVCASFWNTHVIHLLSPQSSDSDTNLQTCHKTYKSFSHLKKC